MPENLHYLAFANLSEAENHLGFVPLWNRAPSDPEAVRVHIRDHRGREVEPTLEVYYQQFVLSQQRCGGTAATRFALEESYGPDRIETEVAGHPAAGYELGDEPNPTDLDPREPSVVAWADGEFFCMLASEELELQSLLDIAYQLYDEHGGGN